MKITIELEDDDGNSVNTEPLEVDRAALALITHAVDRLREETPEHPHIGPPPPEWRTEHSDGYVMRIIRAWVHLTQVAMEGIPNVSKKEMN